ncbi:hypothetical protein [Devosia sp.]|uniref:hypothetical protein n=1 Tax=Devosia sp. TaxID=1871048 RepID=UPI002F0D9210
MRGRLIVVGAAVLALAVPPVQAQAGPLWPVIQLCFLSAQSTQCAFQITRGDRNKALTHQETWQAGHQFALTYQRGDDNRAYTGQEGTDQIAATVQVGDGNAAFTHQEGEDQFSATIQLGDGHWAGTSSIGEDTATFVFQSN